MSETIENMEDRQILQEVALNERIVTHPKFGQVRLRFPTLPIQRKIDAAARLKKKELRNSFDEIEDPNDSSKTIRVPAYKSREALRKEYIDLGWWSVEKEKLMEEISNNQINLLAELEILGFESEDALVEGLEEIQEELRKQYEDDDNPEILEHILLITAPIEADFPSSSEKFLLDAASNTVVDELIDKARILRRMLSSFVQLRRLQVELLELQAEESSLFSDSWQEQLQYFIRLAQVYFCMSTADTNKPLWNSIKELESETVDIIRWAYSELSAFWQGLSDEARERMDKYNFLLRPKEEPEPSEESPEAIPQSSDGESVEPMPETSSKVMDTTDPSPIPNSNSVTGSNSTNG